jgi:hypothetical protein
MMKESGKENMKTFGDKPESFNFTFDDGVTGRFYIGSEVRNLTFLIIRKYSNFLIL